MPITIVVAGVVPEPTRVTLEATCRNCKALLTFARADVVHNSIRCPTPGCNEVIDSVCFREIASVGNYPVD